MKTARYLPSSVSERGVVLLEALIAILIFSIGILGAVGLQAAMIKSTADAKYRAEASYIVQQRLGAMWVDQDNLANYAEMDTPLSGTSSLPDGRRTTTRGEADCGGGDPSCFKVKVTWQQPGNSGTNDIRNVTAVARITGG
jgi:type IV pilus assembly protein PilV